MIAPVRSGSLVLLFAGALVTGCRSGAGGACTLQTDCRGDLLCFCSKWLPYLCETNRQVCTTRSDATATCAKADLCRDDGLCEAPARGDLADNAIPMCDASPAICERRDGDYQGCRIWGKCSEARRICIATSAADCARSEACSKYGACSLDGESCAPSTETECSKSDACKTESLCKLGSGRCVK